MFPDTGNPIVMCNDFDSVCVQEESDLEVVLRLHSIPDILEACTYYIRYSLGSVLRILINCPFLYAVLHIKTVKPHIQFRMFSILQSQCFRKVIRQRYQIVVQRRAIHH